MRQDPNEVECEGKGEVLALHFREPSALKDNPKECALAGGFSTDGTPLLMLWVGQDPDLDTEPLVLPAAAVMAVMLQALGEATTTSLLVGGTTPWDEEAS